MYALLNFLCTVGVILSAALAAEARQPNVVIFLADDQGWGDLSTNGNTNLQTPNIDSLARDGVKFDRFFVSAVCSPTRAEFLTGRYHPRSGVRGVSTGQERMNVDEKTLADALKAAGYKTGAFGKWHNGSQWPYHPNARGFDMYYGFTSGHWGEYFDPPLERNGLPVRGKGFIIDDLTDKALQFIEENQASPFLCYLPYNTPHSPWAVPAQDWDRFKDKAIALRGPNGDREKIEETRCALAMCENLDRNVGRILRRLDELKLTEDTIVIYFSDNGPNSDRWNGGMKGRKGSVDEGGVRSPLLIRWSGKIPGARVVNEITGAIDLLPTVLSLTKVSAAGNKPLDGRDLTPLLNGTNAQWAERTLFQHQAGNVSARTQQYRLDPKGALFDMVADPAQSKDIAKEKPEIAKELATAVAKWRAEILGGSKGARGADPRPFPVGYREFPRTVLPARDGVPHGGIERSARAPNCSYFVNWKNADGFITWDVEVATAGEYEVEIEYTAAQAGAEIELSLDDSKTRGVVAPAWNPPLYTNQDTIPRPAAESQMKEFRTLKLPNVRLSSGRGVLTLRASNVPGDSVMDVRSVALVLKSN